MYMKLFKSYPKKYVLSILKLLFITLKPITTKGFEDCLAQNICFLQLHWLTGNGKPIWLLETIISCEIFRSNTKWKCFYKSNKNFWRKCLGSKVRNFLNQIFQGFLVQSELGLFWVKFIPEAGKSVSSKKKSILASSKISSFI